MGASVETRLVLSNRKSSELSIYSFFALTLLNLMPLKCRKACAVVCSVCVYNHLCMYYYYYYYYYYFSYDGHHH